MKKKLIGVLVGLLVLLVLSFLFVRSPDKTLEDLKPLYTDSESEWIEIDGMQVHHKREGRGEAVVLIHGTGASLHTWDPWTDHLDENFEVFRMDIPAFGLTGPDPDKDYTIDGYVTFVNDYVQKLGVDSFSIGGNSLGGYIAWAYAVKYPEKVNKLILLDAAGYPQQGKTDALAFKVASNPFLSPLMKQITPKSFIRKNLEQVYSDDSKITDALVDRYYDLALREGNRQAFIDRVHTTHEDLSPSIASITCPTLIMWGKDDSWVDLDNAHKFEKDIQGSELIIYDGVGHVPMEEAPNQTAKDALAFLLKETM